MTEDESRAFTDQMDMVEMSKRILPGTSAYVPKPGEAIRINGKAYYITEVHTRPSSNGFEGNLMVKAYLQ